MQAVFIQKKLGINQLIMFSLHQELQLQLRRLKGFLQMYWNEGFEPKNLQSLEEKNKTKKH